MAIKSGSFNRHAISSGVCDSVLLCMRRSDTVFGLRSVFMDNSMHLMSCLIAMSNSCRRANISRDEDSLVFNDDTARAAAVACPPLANNF